ncbi:amidohydrolase family protein [Spongiimicrobium sp. 3-5]|uniref:amidohydrolase family protein n=1 Tax=Spongiimicrobium sp. 3-5 TaxID=3332596 RepID=UPI00398109B9
MKKIVFLMIAMALTACNRAQNKTATPPETGKDAILITDVNIVDVDNGSILENRQIIIDSGKIKGILETVENADGFATQIDGKGKYVIPGLAEMHAHIPPPSTSTERLEETLFLYLSNGITTIRGMLGDPSHLTLREKAKKGEVLSPRIYTSSPSLNGNSVTSVEQATTKVTAYQKDGYDFLKIHPGIQLEVFNEIVRTANEVGITLAGHVPVDVGIRHALESKFASIDHVDGFLEGMVPTSANVDPNDNGFFGYNFTPLADLSKMDELVQLSKDNKVWIVPTQSLFERWFAPIGAEELLAQPEMKYMPKTTLENWKRIKTNSTGADSGFNEAQWQQFINIRRSLIKKLYENGHGMLLGSDAPQLFNVPGFSIHHEMQGMLQAGLTPLQIIRSGTINPALYFGMENAYGSIKEGLSADMVLINANPMEDINALKEISGVMIMGTWLSRETIDEKLASIAENASKN